MARSHVCKGIRTAANIRGLEMTKMTEQEVKRHLTQLGCPYDVLNPRSTAWLQGYQAGYDAASEAAKQTVREHFKMGAA